MALKTLIPKSEARKLSLQRKQNLTPAEAASKTKIILEKLAQTDDFVYADKIFCYVSTKDYEVNTRMVIDFAVGQGKSVFLPKFDYSQKRFRRFQFTGWDDLVKNKDGYIEPRLSVDEDMSDIDLIIAPAMAVSVVGQRVGGGGGYYDRLLKNAFCRKIALAFEFQIFDNIESDIHDVRLDKVITERRVINTRESFRYMG